MPENQNTEWKSKWKDEYLEWICGYANAQGGKIYIGCDDEGNVIGLQNARKLLEDVPNKIRDAMGIIVGVNLFEKKVRNIWRLMCLLILLVFHVKVYITIVVVVLDKFLPDRHWKLFYCESEALHGITYLCQLFR